MKMKIPTKQEKLSVKFEFMVPPSLMELRKQAEAKINLKFPEWARITMEVGLKKLLKKAG